MSVNLGNVELLINRKLSITVDPVDINVLTKALINLQNGVVFTVDTFSDLPPAAENTGNLYYVASNQLVYWAEGLSNTWVPLGNTTSAVTLWGWGQDANFNVFPDGISTATTYSSPTPARDGSFNWCLISTDRHFIGNSYGIQTDGTLWGWGYGQAFGMWPFNCSTSSLTSPIQEIAGNTDWCFVNAGYRTGAAIKTDNTLYFWGDNQFGVMGLNYTANVSAMVQEITSTAAWRTANVGRYNMFRIKTTGELFVTGCLPDGTSGTNIGSACYSSPVQEITSATNWCQGSLSTSLAAAVKTDGSLWSWGANGSGQIGNNAGSCNYSSPVQEITSATNWCCVTTDTINSLAIKTDGTLWAWGNNSGGQLGTNNTISYSSPVQEITSATNWCFVINSRCANHSLAIKTNGALYNWGVNNSGLNLTAGTNLSSPVQEFTSSVWCFATVNNNFKIALKVDSY